MIIRSQLRMNKNIVFPFISCIMIMFTLLVLIHKSADELNTVKKEMAHCKKQYDSAFSQLQNAIDLKLRLEQSLENEKTDGKQKLEKIQMLLGQEKEERRKEKEEASSNYDSLKERFTLIQTEKKENDDQLKKSNKRILELEEELNGLKASFKEVNVEGENKDKIIEELREKLKTDQNGSATAKKPAPSENAAPVGNERLKVASVQNSAKGPSTPDINPAAIVVGTFEEMPKQVVPPPNVEQESIQKEMHDSLNMGVAEEVKSPQENVVKAPQIQTDEDKKDNVANHGDVNGEAPAQNPDKNQPNMFIPVPLNFEQANNKPASSASNNAAENREVLPVPVQAAGIDKENPNVLPKQMKEYQADYNEGEADYLENDINKNKDKNQHIE